MKKYYDYERDFKPIFDKYRTEVKVSTKANTLYEQMQTHGKFVNGWYIDNNADWTEEFKQALVQFDSVSSLVKYVHENGQPYVDKFNIHYLILWGVRFYEGSNFAGGVNVIDGQRLYDPARRWEEEEKWKGYKVPINTENIVNRNKS